MIIKLLNNLLNIERLKMKKSLFVIILLLITPLFTESADKMMRKAARYNANKEFKKAYELGIEAIKIDPNNPFAYFFIGDYYASIGKYDKGINYYSKSIRNYDGIFTIAHYQKAITTMIKNKDLSYCEDINILENHFKEDDTFLFLKEEHQDIFFLCEAAQFNTAELVHIANVLAENGNCMDSEILFNEASKVGSIYDLEKYDKSICSK